MSMLTEQARDRLDRLTLDEQSVVAQDANVIRTYGEARARVDLYNEHVRAHKDGNLVAQSAVLNDMLNGVHDAQQRHAAAILAAPIKHRAIPEGMSVLNIPGMER